MLCCREVAGTERGRPGEVWTTTPTEMTASAAAAGHRMLPNRLHLTVGTARGARECRSAHLYESYFRGESRLRAPVACARAWEHPSRYQDGAAFAWSSADAARPRSRP